YILIAGTTEGSGFCYLCRYQTLKIINQKSQDNDNNESLTPPSLTTMRVCLKNYKDSPMLFPEQAALKGGGKK
ncbi:MAG: hypothetical protein U9N77_10055, partial [Thermodesulfobacteriota bacterium]|nr:hypothetical protein [Thermodesulfobacteriota bacterium]